MPTRIKRPDKNISSAQQHEIARVTTEKMLVSQASYTALAKACGMLYGST
jgi:hypothetical protein